ncbi:BTAD domain-containing putative transcriptional regulator [Umezawaea sp. Da 62-37]|uniref:BTAD domain-containing putative transcriptional regulator n=1 Tax=Umezawaea sp. Da 62-37 TaxID=3075927 RepID=UPI0028F6FE7F|nr:BTAD domain-containing putative transcriptional regulator [Umezawaea sp. Da 62-37]WNV83754.1 BTAD domain-containing putative transcriptional regulator [Umezawaea sp. Da 62-37]
MQVRILGPLEVTEDGVPVAIGGARLRTLLVRLAVGVGRVVTVDELADALWPHDLPVDRVNSARSLVARLRRALPDPAVLRSAPAGYRLDLPPDAVDAHEFERLARSRDDGDLRAALALWRGRALSDAGDAEYATAYAARLDEARLTAIEACAEADLAAGRHDGLVAELAGHAARHPLREPLHALLLRALHAADRRSEALAVYEDVRRRLADELGTDPSAELRQVHRALLRADAAPTRGNLRTALTSFVGREDEVAKVTSLLTRDRLITLVGPGGAGKTRLATTAANRLPGGAWLVELAPVTDPADVPAAVLGALGARDKRTADPDAPRTDSTGRLVDLLSHNDTLIVLDNCEHVVDAAARLAEELLGRCPRLRILATSREPLGLFGETLHPVPTLDVPNTAPSVAEAVASPAVRLLVDRAAAVRPGFAVDEGNAAAVAEICRRLDGLPLAVELAAARLRSLSPRQLADRLDDRFLLLTGGSRTALPRHRTLSAVVAWSWDLLDERERSFAERLAVFPAAISLDAAEHLCPGEALDLLTALADKSLLQVVDAPEPYFRMLETIKEFAFERLVEHGDAVAARRAHAAYFLDFAETAEPHLRGSEQVVWLSRLLVERDNLVAALHFAADTGDADTAVRLGASLGMFGWILGSTTDTRGWLRLALDVPGEQPEPARTITVALHLLNGSMWSGGSEREALIAEFREALQAVDVHSSHPVLALFEPMFAIVTDDVDLGIALVDRRLDHPDPWTRAALWMVRGIVRENDGDMEGMRNDMVNAATGFRAIGDRFGLSQSLSSLAEGHLLFGEHEKAIEAIEESIALRLELQRDDDVSHDRLMLARARAHNGDRSLARAEYEAITREGGRGLVSGHSVTFARSALGDMDRLDGDLEGAERHYAAAMAALDDSVAVPPQLQALVLASQAHVAAARSDAPTAWTLLGTAVEQALATKDMPVLGTIAVAVAAVRARLGDHAGAALALGAAEQLRGAPDALNPDVIALDSSLREEMGDAAYGAAHAEGRGLDRAAAIDQVRRR